MNATMNSVLKAELILVSVGLILNLLPCYGCGQAEYMIGIECCPMCSPGYFVVRHCTEYTSTACLPCSPNTFIDTSNGLIKCFSCTICDSRNGLKVKKSCSTSSDTVCEPLEGFFCIDPDKKTCRAAEEHLKCTPGQYIKQNGTASTDTICGDCAGDTYSDGSFMSCRQHTQCEVMGLQVVKEGTVSSNTECGERPLPHIIIIIPVVLLAVIIAFIIFICIWKKKKRKIRKKKTSRTELAALKP
ncbi:tumor necrosis factor receptor superfamily member 14-like [Denticeps clupeoides]|uniref:TNFR-Cys domain-containing protein n=1 Tax=Denticeps clupeoides TaxID=299321 RepID=A0AAY4BCJ4_9TELE|nr:tumor necrosis factor receptor superfamily member 14-like [Denticeps clupeoides]